LDLGNYERFLDATLNRDNNITTGKIYHDLIEKERCGGFLGKTVQVVPHVCNAIQEWIQRIAQIPVDGSGETADVCVIELGGTIGDIESMPFVEALRQFQFLVGKGNFCLLHVSLVPVIGAVGEQKTKPTQQSVRELRALGLSPDLIVCRSTQPLEYPVKEKISSFCHVSCERVLSVHDVSNIYRVPLLLQNQGLSELIASTLNLSPKLPIPYGLKSWTKLAERYDRLLSNVQQNAIHIALVGKYTNFSDAYHSVLSALRHASLKIEESLVIDWIDASNLEEASRNSDNCDRYEQSWKLLKAANGILVPGGFGDRGIEGKILAANYARLNRIPYLGICLGMQVAVIEVARNVLMWNDANSTEFNETTEHKVVIYMPEISKTHKGGTMRLGKRKTYFQKNAESTLLLKLYRNQAIVEERHRHRFEVNPEIVDTVEKKSNFRFVAKDESGQRMEALECLQHPFFVAVQYHPEFKSRPLKPSPPFVGLLLAASHRLEEWIQRKSSPNESPTISPTIS